MGVHLRWSGLFLLVASAALTHAQEPRPFCTPDRFPLVADPCVFDRFEVQFVGEDGVLLGSRIRPAGDGVITTAVTLDVDSAEIVAFSYAVKHDPAILELESVTDEGADLLEFISGGFDRIGPAFIGDEPGRGIVHVTVLSFQEPGMLPRRNDVTLSFATYRLVGELPLEGTKLELAPDELSFGPGEPVLEIAVVVQDPVQPPGSLARYPATVTDALLVGNDDCNQNGTDDTDDIGRGDSADVNGNGLPDECEADCNENLLPDGFEVDRDPLLDCDRNGSPDECDLREETDCNGNGRLDVCDLALGTSTDLDASGIPDECEVVPPGPVDCNDNGLPDAEDVASGRSPDCNGNGVPDECDLQVLVDGLTVARGIPLPLEPQRVAAGDFDGNGALDFVIGDGVGSALALLRGGDGGEIDMAGLLELPRGGPDDVAAGDIDGDGALDVVTSHGLLHSLSVLYGRGDGSFEPAAVVSELTGPELLAIADLDGDGAGDIVVAAPATGTLMLVAGARDRQLGSPTMIELGVRLGAVATADVIRDGFVDVVVAATDSSEVLVLAGNGDGTLGVAERLGVSRPLGVVLEDFDGDGRTDIASRQAGGISLWLARVAGSFEEPTVIDVDRGLADFTAADVGGDALPEILVVGEGKLLVLRRQLDGLYEPAGRFATGVTSGPVLTGDVDGDGAVDVITASAGTRELTFLAGAGDGDFVAAPLTDLELLPVSAALADFNLDGRTDIAFVNRGESPVVFENRTLTVLFGESGGQFGDGRDITVRGLARDLAAGDVNRDGITDLVVVDTVNSLSTLLGRDDRSFELPRLSDSSATTVHDIALADFDGDGRLDAALAQSSIGIRFGIGDGTFAIPPTVITPPGDVRALALGDFDGDGEVDIAGANVSRDGPVQVFIVRGSVGREFHEAESVTSLNRPRALVTGDFDGDGFDDLAVGGLGESVISIHLSRGDGTFRRPNRVTISGQASSLVSGDIDGDGSLDLAAVVEDAPRPRLIVFRGRGDGFFLPGAPIGFGDEAVFLVAGDLDRDGVVDLVSGNEREPDRRGSFTVFANASQRSRDCDRSGTLDECEIAGNPDLDLNLNGQIDACERDCNGNGIPDDTEITSGAARDCNSNLTPDDCDIARGRSVDINIDGIPDECQPDCDRDGIPDAAELAGGASMDCNVNGVPDECDLASRISVDVNGNSVPDECDPDCNANGTPDDFEIEIGAASSTRFTGPVRLTTGRGDRAIAAADLNRDGLLDIATARAESNDVLVLLQGDGFLPGNPAEVGESPIFILGADFNGDQITDLVTVNRGSRDASVLLGKGDGTFQAERRFAAEINPRALAAAHLDGDEFLDMVVIPDGEGPGGEGRRRI